MNKTMLDASGTTTYTFDNNGNQRTTETPGNAVTTNIWDYENHLINLEQSGVDIMTFAYDPDGLRASIKQGATETKFIWDDQIYLLETDGSDTTTAVFTNEPSTYGSLISQRKSSNTNTFHFDGLGSTRSVTASDESITDTIIFDAWGEQVLRTGSTDIGFQYVGSQGYYRDTESDLFYIRARIYNPTIASWTSVDPLSIIEALPRYLYVSNNPMAFVDPSGRWDLFCVCNYMAKRAPLWFPRSQKACRQHFFAGGFWATVCDRVISAQNLANGTIFYGQACECLWSLAQDCIKICTNIFTDKSTVTTWMQTKRTGKKTKGKVVKTNFGPQCNCRKPAAAPTRICPRR